MRTATGQSPQAGRDPYKVNRSFLIASSIAIAILGVSTAVLAGASSDRRIVLVAVASWIIFIAAIRELISGRLRALMVITASVIAVGILMPFQTPDVVHALSAFVILLAMAGHALRAENQGDMWFLVLVTGVWVSQLVWTQPPFASFDQYHVVQWLIQTGLFLFGVKAVGMLTSALSVSERRYDSLFRAAPVGLIDADFSAIGAWLAGIPADGPIAMREYFSRHPDQIAEATSLLDVRAVNKAALSLLGLESEEDLIHQLAKISDSQKMFGFVTEQLVAIWEGRADFEMKYDVRRADGEQFSAILRTTFPESADGSLGLNQGMISVTNISGMVAALKSRDDLLASVTHEMRPPLDSLVDFSHELSERPEDLDEAEKARTVDIIVRQADALNCIIDNLMVVSRRDRSALTLHMEPIEMATYLASISMDLGPTRTRTPLRFGSCEVVLFADRLRLGQILRNLVDNAATYGGDEITIDAITRGDVGIVAVSDNGVGLPEGKKNHVFERYQQRAPADDEPVTLGLGLPVARNLARAMGGDLTHSRRDDLTIFELTLRLPATSALSDAA